MLWSSYHYVRYGYHIHQLSSNQYVGCILTCSSWLYSRLKSYKQNVQQCFNSIGESHNDNSSNSQRMPYLLYVEYINARTHTHTATHNLNAMDIWIYNQHFTLNSLCNHNNVCALCVYTNVSRIFGSSCSACSTYICEFCIRTHIAFA